MFRKTYQVTINYVKLPTFLLVVFSGFYLTRLVQISPIYLSFVFSFIIFLIGYFYGGKRQFNLLSLPVLVNFIYLIVTQPFNHPEILTLLNVLFSLAYLILILNTAPYISQAELIHYSKIFIVFTILLLTIEAAWRLSHPIDLAQMVHNNANIKDTEQLILPSNNGASGLNFSSNKEAEKNLFYTFKISSIMFQDSNFVGTYGLTSFFFYLFLLRERFVKTSIPLYILGFLILLTLSRSAIITIPLTYLLIAITKKNRSMVYMVLFLFLLLVGTLFIFQGVANDESFLSKIRILILSSNHLSHLSFIDLMNGVGFGNTVHYLGIAAHNIFLTYLIESGIVGFTLFLIINLMFIKGTNRKSLYLTIPLFISGMSLSGHVLTFYYTCLTILYLLCRSNPSNLILAVEDEIKLQTLR